MDEDLRHLVRSPVLDLAPPKSWRRFVPLWLRSLIWVDSAQKYDAFLSYSWKSDRGIAPVIQSVIQRFLCPWYRLRAKTVFRDLSCLPAGSSLKSELFDRLDRSKHLIVFASPGAAQSEGMELEARHWFSQKREGQVLIVITGGECETWAEIRERLLPASVRSNLESEPLWVSLRRRRSEILSNPRSNQLRGELIEDLKQVLLRFYPSRDWGQLRGEERLQRRRAIGLAIGVAASLAVLLVATVFAGWWAVRNRNGIVATLGQGQLRQIEADLSRNLAEQQKDLAVASGRAAVNQWKSAEQRRQEAEQQRQEAERQRAVAVEQRNLAIARQLAAQSERAGSEAPSLLERAVLLAVHSLKLHPTLEGNMALQLSLPLLPDPVVQLGDNHNRVFKVSLSPDGRYIATGGDGASVWEIPSGKQISLREKGFIEALKFSRNGRFLATRSKDENVLWEVWEVPSGKQIPLTHQGAIVTLKFSPDSRYIATSSKDGITQVCELANNRVIWQASYKSVHDLVFSPNSGYIAVGSEDGIAVVRQVATDKVVSAVTHKGAILALAFSPDGRYVATAGSEDKIVRVWEPKSGAPISLVHHDGDGAVTTLDFSPNSRYIATGSGRTSRVWESVSGKEVSYKRHESEVQWVEFAPDGNHVVAKLSVQNPIFGELPLIAWDIRSGIQVGQESADEIWTDAAFSRDGHYLAMLSMSRSICLFDVLENREMWRSSHFGDTVRSGNAFASIAFSPDGQFVAAVSWDPCVRVFETSSGTEVLRVPNDGLVDFVGFSTDGPYFAIFSSHFGRAVRVFKAPLARETLKMSDGKPLNSVAFGVDGRSLLAGTQGGIVDVWAVGNARPIAEFPNGDAVTAVALNPDGRTLAVASFGHGPPTLQIVDAANGTVLKSLGKGQVVGGLAFSRDGRYLAARGARAQIWRVDTWETRANFSLGDSPFGISPVAFWNGEYLLTAGKGVIHFWDVRTQEAKGFIGLGFDDSIISLAVSPDGLYVGAGTKAGAVRILQVKDGQQIAALFSQGYPMALSFTGDGNRLLLAEDQSRGKAGAVANEIVIESRLWRSDDLTREACARLSRNLNLQEVRNYLGTSLRYSKTCDSLPDDVMLSLLYPSLVQSGPSAKPR